MRIQRPASGLLLALFVTAAGCGSGSTDTPPGTGPGPGTPTVASVVLTPANFTLFTGDTLRFSAAAFASGGAPMTASFTWGATGGTVTTAGLFTAAGVAGNASVWAGAGTKADTSTGTVATQSPTTIDTVFSEGFESGNFSRWDDRGLAANQAIVTTEFHSGTRALQATYTQGSDAGWLTKFFLPGYDSLYVSYWLKLQSGWLSGTKMLTFFGSRTDNQWSATGTAGVCPNGTDFFILSVVQERTGTPGGPSRFYAQYPSMPRTPPTSTTCFGHDGISAGAAYTTPLEVTPGSWHRVEYWAKLNTPGQANLEQRFCIDGVVRGIWSNISVRSSTILRLNAVTISNSISGGSPQTQLMWADDVLVTRQRPPGSC